jgi:hypothetical protein
MAGVTLPGDGTDEPEDGEESEDGGRGATEPQAEREAARARQSGTLRNS